MRFGVGMIAAVVLAGALSGCAGVPKVVDPSGVDLSLSRLTERQMLALYGAGTDDDPNPYVTPGSLLSSSDAEYIVLRLDVVAARRALISLNEVTARDDSGKQLATLYTWPDFKAWLKSWSMDDKVLNIEYVKAESSYIPGMDFQVGVGRRSYYLVLIGKRPIPKPCTVLGSFSIDSDTTKNFTVEVPKS